MHGLVLTSMLWSLCIACTGEKDSPVTFPTLPELTDNATIKVNTEEGVEIKEWDIALVGEVRGELEPCGCPTLPYGGFKRRYNAIQSLKTEQPLFHLDAGELLLKGFFSNKTDNASDRAHFIAELSNDVGVDAWAVGPSDLMAVGLDRLQRMPGPARTSATWVSNENEYLFPPYLLLEKSNVRLAVIGLSAKPTDPNWQQFTTLSTKEAIQRVLPSIPTDIDLLIALGSMDDEEILPLQSTFPEVQLFLTTEGAAYDEPKIHGGTPIIEAPKQGRFIQRLHFRHNAATQRLPESGLTETEWRQWLTITDTDHPLHQKMMEIGAGRILLYSELIPLSGTFDTPIAFLQEKLAQFATERIETSQAIAEQPVTQTDPGYAASGRCAQCHSSEMAKWSFSQHARAWESLIAHPVKDSTSNPECIGCHTTGFGQVGGFGEPSIANIRKFKAVQCESCHGPMRGHPHDKSVVSTPISESTCTGCHDSANSPDFEFDTYLRLATCQSKQSAD